MSFTDDDLKIMKAGYDVGGQKLHALLARMEAAEAYIQAKANAPYKAAKEYEAWRKASGKTGEG